jgi:DNA-binding response OmpR family regulator
MSGLDLMSEIRKHSEVPIIFVTGKGGETDRVLGLRLGADDYVVKPFSSAELVARIHSVLRRAHREPTGEQRLEFDELVVDLQTREVLVRGDVIDTTAKEFDLLVFLAQAPRRVFSREQILKTVWDSSTNWQDAATVTEHVRRLRKKIEKNPDEPRWLRTVRGVGYRFEP